MSLLRLLDAGAKVDAEYRGGLSNHLPMALLALFRLGAGDQRIQAFAARYAQRLEPAPPAAAWPPGDAWRSRLGQRDAWPAYRHLFLQWLHSDDSGDVLRTVLPPLMQGCGAAAFHGLIRTAYAVQSGHRQELADALAYWSCRWLDLGHDDRPQRGRETSPAVALLRLPDPGDDLTAGLIFQRMQAVAALPGFNAAVARLRVTPATLPQLAQGAAELYAGSGNFTVLHLLTSAHALRVLLPWLPAPVPAVRAYWRAWAAAWAASGARPQGRAAPLRPWRDIVAHAVASDDDHVVKLVYSCREQQRACRGLAGGLMFQRAASRVLADADAGFEPAQQRRQAIAPLR